MQCYDKTHLSDALRNDITIAVRSPRAYGGAMISFCLLGGGKPEWMETVSVLITL